MGSYDISITQNNVGRIDRLAEADYASAHDANAGDYIQNHYHQMLVGQYKSGTPTYSVYRGGIEFNLATLAGLTLSACKLHINLASGSTVPDFDITIVDGKDLGATFVAADFGELLDETTSWGELNTAGLSLGFIDITLNATGLAAVQAAIAGGVIRFGIRSSRDISSTEPTGDERISFIGNQVTETNEPKLIATVIVDEPTVTTQAVTAIAATTATGNGTIVSIGDTPVTQHGHCWSTSANPTTVDSKTENGAGSVGSFTSSITELSPNTLYHTRAYATNAGGTAYGDDVEFTTLAASFVQTAVIG